MSADVLIFAGIWLGVGALIYVVVRPAHRRR